MVGLVTGKEMHPLIHVDSFWGPIPTWREERISMACCEGQLYCQQGLVDDKYLI